MKNIHISIDLILKRIICAFVLVMSGQTLAASIDAAGNYEGTIQGVGVGFWGHIGVGLTGGVTCAGHSEVVLKKDAAGSYKDVLSVLLAAEASGKMVHIYNIAGRVETFAPGYNYCVIYETSLGDFKVW